MFFLWQRFQQAATTWPSGRDWIGTLLLLTIAATLCAAYGVQTDFLRWTKPPRPRHCLRLWAVAWVMPALIEEILFRVLPLPHPREAQAWGHVLVTTGVALAVFVLAHPLRTLLRPTHSNAVFADKRFLVLALLLGAACSVAYLVTGSLWPPVVVHQTLVAGWLILLGGWQKVAPE